MTTTTIQSSKGLSIHPLPPELPSAEVIRQLAVNPVEGAISKALQSLEKTLIARLEQGLKDVSLRIGGVEVPLSLVRAGNNWTLRLAAGTPVALPSLVDLMDTAGGSASGLPAQLAQFTQLALSDVEGHYDAATRKLTRVRFVVTSVAPWSLVELPGISVEKLRLELEVSNPTSQPRLHLIISGAVRLGELTLPIHAERKDGRWIFSTPTLQDTTQTLRQLAQQLLLKGFTLPEGVPDLRLAGLRLSADLDAKRLTLSSTTPARAQLGTLSFESESFEVRLWALDPSAPHRGGLGWHVALQGAMKLAHAVNVRGALTLSRTSGDEGGLAFEPQQADLTLPLPIPKHQATMVFGLGATRLSRTARGWQLESSANVAFSGLPAVLQKHLPERSQGTIKATQEGVTLTVDRLLKAVKFTLPDIRAHGTTLIPLGEVLLDATNFSLELDRDPRFSMMLELGLPSKLNNVFGTQADGAPLVEFFRTMPETLKLEFSAGPEGVKLAPQSSPLEAITLEQVDGASWAYVRMGEFGEARLQVPQFSYHAPTGSLRASGAFEMTKPLRLPLSLFKRALTAAHRKDVADMLPDSLAMTEFKPLGADGRLDAPKLVRQLEKILGGALPQPVRDVVGLVAGRINDLPDRFRQYLSIELPEKLSFDISITPDGGARINVKAPGDKPLRVLFSNPLDVFQLIGVELRGFSFGETFAGALFLCQVDARVDCFDLVTLAAALTGVHQKLGLAPSTSFQKTFILDNLLTLIVWQAGVPIPIPMFFDELGMVYAGLEGGRFETHWGLSVPSANLAEGVQLTQELVRFFKEPDYLLDKGTSLERMKLQLRVGPNFLALPRYLGGMVLGSKDKVVKIDLFDKVATVLNTFKTGDVADLVTLVPIQDRMGQVPVKFGPLEAEAAWLFTTVEEFQALGHERLGVVKGASAEVLSVLPPDATRGAKGLVTLLKGRGKLGGLEVSSVFGLAATSTEGLRTGFRAEGSAAGLGRLELSGQVAVPRNALMPTANGGGHSPIQVGGRLTLSQTDGTPIFEGQVAHEGETLSVLGKLDLFPRSPRLRITGQLAGRISPRDFAFSGSASMALGPAFTLASASAILTQDSLSISGSWQGQTVRFAARKADGGMQLEAAMSPIIVGDALRITDLSGKSGPSALLKVGGDGAPRLALDGSVQLLGLSQATRVDISEQGVQFEVRGKLFNQFDAALAVRGGNLGNGDALSVKASLSADFSAFIQEKAVQIIQNVTDGATRELTAARQRVKEAQDKLSGIDWEINRTRGIIQADRARDLQRLTTAREDVNKAQAKVNTLDGDIQRMRATIEGERRGVRAKLDKARADLDAAQREVNRLRGEINETQRWYNGLPRVALPHKPSQVREAAVFAAKMAGLNTAHAVATGALEVAKKAVEVLQGSLNLAPMEGDPRLAGLYTARAAATAGLTVAQQALAAIQNGIKEIDPDLDPRIVGLFAGKAAATEALKLANNALGELMRAVGELAEVSTYIAQSGVGTLLNVRSASFEASLNAVRGGKVHVQAELVFMKRTRNVSFTHDFHNPLDGAKALVSTLLPAR